VQENPLTFVKFGINYSSFTSLGLKFNITSQDLLLKESRALATVDMSQYPRFYLEYYKYLGRSRTFGINLSYYYENIDYPVYNYFRLQENLRSKYSEFDLRLQYNLSNNMYIGFGQQFISSAIRTPGSPVNVYNGHNNYLKSYISYILNTLDKKYYSTRGWKVRAEAGYVFAQSPEFIYTYNNETVNSDTLGLTFNNYARLFLSADHYKQLTGKMVFSQNVTIAYIVDDNPYISDQFRIGGINQIMSNQIPFAGLEESEVKTGSTAMAKLGLQYQFSKNIYLTGRFNAALYDFHKSGAGSINVLDNLLTGYGLTFGYDSAIGPIDITVMYCDQDRKLRYNMNLGFSF
jgi:NTE family protein